MYEPSDDSYLMEKYVKKFARGKILDIGCGSGILMKAALEKSKNVFGVDIDEDSVEYCRKLGLNATKSDLFSNVKEKFDFIIFNPPYLPEDEPFLKRNIHERKNIDIIGGRHGYELIERFFSEAGKYLNKNGRILIVFSSLTDKNKVDEIILKNGFEFELLEDKSVGLMERIYIYRCYR